MIRRRAGAAGAALLLVASGCAEKQPERRSVDAAKARVTKTFRLQPVADGLVRPTFVSAAPGDPRGLWVLEQPGRVVRVEGTRRTEVLDLRHDVVVGAEQGLLGMAFHPGFARNRRFVVDYTDRRGDTRVVEYRVGRGGRARPSSRRELLFVRQPEENHNGGAMAFGLDGRLWVGMGDGGGAFDPRANAQDPRSKLGKVIAADVDRPGRPKWEVVLSGLRNPWRMWFDPAMSELWLGDVGQDEEEEVDRVAIEPDEPPKNLGWPRWEGEHRDTDRRLRGKGDLVRPTVTYPHGGADCSVTSGQIYRGTRVPALNERFVFGDFCSGRLWTLRPKPGRGVRDIRREAVRAPQLTHIGADARGELVLATADGRIRRVVPAGR